VGGGGGGARLRTMSGVPFQGLFAEGPAEVTGTKKTRGAEKVEDRVNEKQKKKKKRGPRGEVLQRVSSKRRT